VPESRVGGVRLRLLGVVLLAAAVVGGGLALERAAGRGEPGEARGGLTSGAWFCPHGGGRGWRGWVVVANPGPRAVRVRLTSLGPEGPTPVGWVDLPPLAQRYREVPAARPGAATVVESFGGLVGAATVLEPARPGEAAASRCVAGARSTWFVLDQPAGEGERSVLVAMNPFGVDAQFDVVIRTERRTVRPSVLTPVIVPPGTSAAIRVDRFVLEAPGEPTVTAQVVRRAGRVVVGGLAVAPEGVRAEAAVGSLEERWVGPAPMAVGGRLVALNPGAAPASLAVLSAERDEQRVLSGAQGPAMGAEGILALPLSGLRRGGLVVEASGAPGVAAELVLAARGGGTAATGLAAAPERWWLVLPTVPPGAREGRQVLVLTNPGTEPAQVDVRLLGEAGPVPTFLRTVQVPEGRSVQVDLGGVAGGRPVTALLRATEGAVVAGGAWVGPSGEGYAATVGLSSPLG
jgi:hypothetical protein